MKYTLPALALLLISCSTSVKEATPLMRSIAITPDYAEVTMPCNIAPPTFYAKDSLGLTELQAVFQAEDIEVAVKQEGEDGICIDEADWHSLIQASHEIKVRIQGKQQGKWVEYTPFTIYISTDSIDSYLAYRLVEPGYEVWKDMGIYQRNLETYDEEAIITNRETNGGCINCHSFPNGNPNYMVHHQRLEQSGTYIMREGKTERHTPDPSLVYPYWHPSRRFIAFSTNLTKQMFHTTDRNRIEVFDYASDVVVYDIERQEQLSCPLLHSDTSFETFPAFSPDGSTLYFCTADSVDIPKDYDKTHYSLCSIHFDAATRTFGSHIDTLYNARTQGGSASFPRVSPDGSCLVFTHHDYGNFSIWHHEADLWMLPLLTSENKKADNATSAASSASTPSPVAVPYPIPIINSSSATDSYHSWSTNSRWLVFSSRRDDGLYTRPYITHMDHKGNFTKPFLLPQRDAAYYDRLMKSFNIPELIISKVKSEH